MKGCMYKGLYYSALDCLQPPPLACNYYHKEERYSACSHNKLATVNKFGPQGSAATRLQEFVCILQRHFHKKLQIFEILKKFGAQESLLNGVNR